MRELMARIVRNTLGRVVCIIADYSTEVIDVARRFRAMVIADRPPTDHAATLRSARAAGDLKGLVIVDTAGDQVPPFAGAPGVARSLIVANGEHSAAEAVAFDMHRLGHSYERIGEWLSVDAVTARTFVRRANRKMKRHPDIGEVLHHLGAAPGPSSA